MRFILRAGPRDPYQYRHYRCVDGDVDNTDTAAHQKLSYHVAPHVHATRTNQPTIPEWPCRDVSFGSEADICAAKRHVRFTPNSDIDCVFRRVCFWANNGHEGPSNSCPLYPPSRH